MNKTILFFHHSVDLYGSDKSLFYLILGLKKINYKCIVVLPEKGPLSDIMESNGIEIIYTPIILLSRSMFKPFNLLNIPFDVLKSINKINKKLKGRKVDIIHTNTMGTLLGAIYSKKENIFHIWTIREIIKNPKIVRKIYNLLIAYFTDITIANSHNTLSFWQESKILTKVSAKVIWNGISREYPYDASIVKELKSKNKDKIIVGLVGRINKWKGHKLLLNAILLLINRTRIKNIKVIFVGDTSKGKIKIQEDLNQFIIEHSLQEIVEIVPFQKNIWKYWDIFDIAVVPSTEPEPFGRVAVEAMFAGKPVIVANHGGLKEIVLDNQTGLLFEPRNAEDLSLKLETLINNPKLRARFGNKGKERAKDYFSLESYINQYHNLYQELNNENKPYLLKV